MTHTIYRCDCNIFSLAKDCLVCDKRSQVAYDKYETMSIEACQILCNALNDNEPVQRPEFTYSALLIEQAKGLTLKEIALHFRVSVSYLKNCLQRIKLEKELSKENGGDDRA